MSAQTASRAIRMAAKDPKIWIFLRTRVKKGKDPCQVPSDDTDVNTFLEDP